MWKSNGAILLVMMPQLSPSTIVTCFADILFNLSNLSFSGVEIKAFGVNISKVMKYHEDSNVATQSYARKEVREVGAADSI